MQFAGVGAFRSVRAIPCNRPRDTKRLEELILDTGRQGSDIDCLVGLVFRSSRRERVTCSGLQYRRSGDETPICSVSLVFFLLLLFEPPCRALSLHCHGVHFYMFAIKFPSEFSSVVEAMCFRGLKKVVLSHETHYRLLRIDIDARD